MGITELKHQGEILKQHGRPTMMLRCFGGNPASDQDTVSVFIPILGLVTVVFQNGGKTIV